MEGVAAEDQAVLRRSWRKGLRSAGRDLDHWQDPVLVQDADVDVRGIGRFHVRAFADDLYHALPAREPGVLKYLESHLSGGDTFIDAGANIGFYSVVASRKVGPQGQVIAVEMMPDTATILRDHIEMNHLANVKIVEEALSDHAGEIVEATVMPGKFGQASIANHEMSPDLVNRVKLTTTTIDEIVGPIDGSIAVIKLDLEGAEYPALKGAANTLGRTNAVVFEQLGSDTSARGLLEDAGFAVHQIEGHNFVAEKTRVKGRESSAMR
jgi:FkbM family methyltransferase